LLFKLTIMNSSDVEGAILIFILMNAALEVGVFINECLGRVGGKLVWQLGGGL
jgi:hypothetical protein